MFGSVFDVILSLFERFKFVKVNSNNENIQNDRFSSYEEAALEVLLRLFL